MSEVIRPIGFGEMEELEYLLRRSYGFWPGFIEEHYPDVRERAREYPDCHLVIEKDGRIVSHVGTYPMELVVGEARVRCGAVGGVGTLPEERGRGHMSRLMEESVKRMRQNGMWLSVLWGDQQRYQNFGYETCGIKYRLRVTRRGLERAGIAAGELTEADPRDQDAVEHVGRMYAILPYRVERPALRLQLQRRDVRLFLSPDGYLLTNKAWGGSMHVSEVCSRDGREAESLLTMLDITFASGADVEVGGGDVKVLGRLLRVASGWSVSPQGMFRIVDWPELASRLRPALQKQGAGVGAFRIAIGCRWGEETQWATVDWDEEKLEVIRGKNARKKVELGVRELTAAVLGGPHPQREMLGGFGKVLPVPVHIPSLDHV